MIHFQVDAKQDSVISKLGQRVVYVHLVFAFPLHIAPPPPLMGGLYRDAVPYRGMKNVLQCHCTTFRHVYLLF